MLDCMKDFIPCVCPLHQLTNVKAVKELILWLDHVVNKVYIYYVQL